MRIACLWFQQEVDLARIAEDCLRFTPQIALREPDILFLEIGKCYRIYSEEQFLRRANALFRRLDLPVQIGMGDCLEEALLAARYADRRLEDVPITALPELADPYQSDSAAVGALAKLVDSLLLLGVKTLGQFKAVPRRELASRFGAVGLLCRQKLDQEVLAQWKPWVPPEVVSESLEYLYSDFAGAVEPLLFDAKKLLDRIFVRLRLRALKAAAIKISLECEKISVNPSPLREHTLNFLIPQCETKGTLSILREYFNKEFARRPMLSPLEKFTLTVAQAVPGHAGQRHLFHAREERNEALAALLSQLSVAHGAGSVFQAEPLEERLPEHSWKKVAELTNKVALAGHVPLRPTHLVKLQKIQVTETHVYIQKKSFQIKRWSETVERISARWVEGVVERTYFQVEVEDGPLLWIFLDKAEQYYLHGFYG